MKLGIFDSGAGGLSVLKNILEAQIFESIIYYGDTARLPYGTKHPLSIAQFSLEALDFFHQQQTDMIVVACNTASAYGLKHMQKKSKIPIIGVIEPGILALQNKIKNLDAKILILATKATIQSKQYQNHLIKLGYHNLTAIATSLFVPLVEENIFEGKILDEVMHFYFKDIHFIPDAIILGCTHFPLLSASISNYFNHKSTLIHSGEAIIDFIQRQRIFSKTPTTKLEFYASSDVETLKETANKWLHLPNYSFLKT
ncbi:MULTISPECIES: glutamate racemase [unclassified Helicobacter]|uniref:glutamate racemase n=1 Tax=unclassified Helicobacter TaxID=2593540 RepID=UPI000CF0866E|nr:MULTISPECIES: glutamate racemase [unclassified Helicobacter]